MRDVSDALRVLIETAPDGVVVIDADTKCIVDANEVACDICGRPRDEFVGAPSDSILGLPEPTEVVDGGGGRWAAQPQRLDRDGSTLPVDIASSELTLGEQRLRLVWVRDVSKQLSDEAALKASEAKFATAFKTSPDAVNLARLADGSYIEVNDGFVLLTGYSAEEVIGRTSEQIGIWNDPADYLRFVEGFSTFGHVDDLVAGFRRKDGSVMQGSLSCRVVEIAGEPCVMSVTRDITDRIAAQNAVIAARERLSKMVAHITEAMGQMVEIRDPYTQGHQVRVSRVASLLAREMAFTDEDAAQVELAALVHDVGKLSVPAEILSKPGPLTAVEFELVKTHSAYGYEILKSIDFGAPIAEIVLQHHERMDGSGYPSGLRGEEIRLESRILCVADVVEAMASHRPYRPAVGLQSAVQEISSHPERYDPGVVSACLALDARGELNFLN